MLATPLHGSPTRGGHGRKSAELVEVVWNSLYISLFVGQTSLWWHSNILGGTCVPRCNIWLFHMFESNSCRTLHTNQHCWDAKNIYALRDWPRYINGDIRYLSHRLLPLGLPPDHLVRKSPTKKKQTSSNYRIDTPWLVTVQYGTISPSCFQVS